MRAALACSLGVMGLIFAAATTAAASCPAVGEGAAGPLPGGTVRADFGAIPEACPGSEVVVRLRGVLVLAGDAPDYYRSFEGSLMVRARHAIADRTWLSFAFDAGDYLYVENAGLGASQLSVGAPTVGIYRTLLEANAVSAAVYVRALLPLETSRHVGFQTGLELGGAFRATPGARWVLDGGAALTVPTDLAGGQVHGHLIPVGLIEGWGAIRRWVAVGLGVTVRAELAPNPSLLSATPRASVRATIKERFWLAALVEAPILGQFLGPDRTDLVAGVFAGYTP